MMRYGFLFLLCIVSSLTASDFDQVPVSSQGRFLPASSYAKQWLYETYHRRSFKNEDLAAFHLQSGDPLPFILQLDLLGHQPWDESPLFLIRQSSLKSLLDLPLKSERFSFAELKNRVRESLINSDKSVADEFRGLVQQLDRFETLRGNLQADNRYIETLSQLQSHQQPKQLSVMLEQQFPLRSRLQQAGSLLKVLPGKLAPGEWYSLHALDLQVYNPLTKRLEPVPNFTLYSDEVFSKLRQHYRLLIDAVQKQNSQAIASQWDLMAALLKESYQHLESKPYLIAAGKQLVYPSRTQLQAEYLYDRYPLVIACIIGYGLALTFFLLGYSVSSNTLTFAAIALFLVTILMHGSLLLIRSFILGRPPVSNMFETLLYVPWITTLASLYLWKRFNSHLPLAIAALASLALLILLQITQLDHSFSNVQAVLDSQYWLIIHVLMIVGSYGLFILSGLLGHAYLALAAMRQDRHLKFLASLILSTLYFGVGLLVPGTLLGGVWAAESWGRFWDWDPKESWAFISICVYLVVIHCYRFNRIGDLGLSIGSILGMLAISFTWYGVNYLLGTGLHSYGFGSGGEYYYYAYLCAEIVFVVAAYVMIPKQTTISLQKSQH